VNGAGQGGVLVAVEVLVGVEVVVGVPGATPRAIFSGNIW
jgi:hypothetical protein